MKEWLKKLDNNLVVLDQWLCNQLPFTHIGGKTIRVWIEIKLGIRSEIFPHDKKVK